MELTLHLTVAVLSIVVTTLAYIKPSRAVLGAATTAVTLTLVTGTYLTLLNHGHLLQACASGLAYVTGMSVMIAVAYRRLARVPVSTDEE